MESDFDPGTPSDDVVGDEPSAPDGSTSLAWMWYVIVVLVVAAFAWGVRGWMTHAAPTPAGAGVTTTTPR